jgi:hypothetical protein
LYARVQLSVQLVFLSAVHWQQIYHSFTQQQQQALLLDVEEQQQLEGAGGTPAAGGASVAARKQLNAAQDALHYCCVYLDGLVIRSWLREQWQPLLQLVQQQEGGVLLQGLTLALHCTSLDTEFAKTQLQKAKEQHKGPIRVEALLDLFSVGMYVRMLHTS